DVRHGVNPIGGDLEVEDRVAAVRLPRLDGVADLGEPLRELVVGEPGEIDVVAEPVAGELHRGADSSGSSSSPASSSSSRSARLLSTTWRFPGSSMECTSSMALPSVPEPRRRPLRIAPLASAAVT